MENKYTKQKLYIYIFWFMLTSNGRVQVYSSERRKVTQVLLNIQCFSSGRGDNKRGQYTYTKHYKPITIVAMLVARKCLRNILVMPPWCYSLEEWLYRALFFTLVHLFIKEGETKQNIRQPSPVAAEPGRRDNLTASAAPCVCLGVEGVLIRVKSFSINFSGMHQYIIQVGIDLEVQSWRFTMLASSFTEVRCKWQEWQGGGVPQGGQVLTTTQSSVGSAKRPGMTNVAWHRHQDRGKDYTFRYWSYANISLWSFCILVKSVMGSSLLIQHGVTCGDVTGSSFILGSSSTAGGRRDNFRYAVT